jgi:hypothetical protein
MLLFRRLLTSCVLFIVLSLVTLIIIGTVVGTHGGTGNAPVLRDYDSSFGAGHRFGYDITRRYDGMMRRGVRFRYFSYQPEARPRLDTSIT